MVAATTASAPGRSLLEVAPTSATASVQEQRGSPPPLTLPTTSATGPSLLRIPSTSPAASVPEHSGPHPPSMPVTTTNAGQLLSPAISAQLSSVPAAQPASSSSSSSTVSSLTGSQTGSVARKPALTGTLPGFDPLHMTFVGHQQDHESVANGIFMQFAPDELETKRIAPGTGTAPGRATYASTGEVVRDGQYIFVMDAAGNVHIDEHVQDVVHHSSLAGGRAPAAAGELRVAGGTIKMVNEKSGHYQPPRGTAKKVIAHLNQQGFAPGVQPEEFSGTGVVSRRMDPAKTAALAKSAAALRAKHRQKERGGTGPPSPAGTSTPRASSTHTAYPAAAGRAPHPQAASSGTGPAGASSTSAPRVPSAHTADPAAAPRALQRQEKSSGTSHAEQSGTSAGSSGGQTDPGPPHDQSKSVQ